MEAMKCSSVKAAEEKQKSKPLKGMETRLLSHYDATN